MKRPNILYIMADDHTSQAWGCYGSRLAPYISTPTIDRLAAEGARLDNCFCTNSICVPSRATILTGQYSHVNDVRTLADALDPDRDTVAKRLQAAGYRDRCHRQVAPAHRAAGLRLLQRSPRSGSVSRSGPVGEGAGLGGRG